MLDLVLPYISLEVEEVVDVKEAVVKRVISVAIFVANVQNFPINGENPGGELVCRLFCMARKFESQNKGDEADGSSCQRHATF